MALHPVHFAVLTMVDVTETFDALPALIVKLIVQPYIVKLELSVEDDQVFEQDPPLTE